MVSKQPYTPYQMEFTMLSDFSEEDLDEVMDVKQKHSGRGSSMNPLKRRRTLWSPHSPRWIATSVLRMLN